MADKIFFKSSSGFLLLIVFICTYLFPGCQNPQKNISAGKASVNIHRKDFSLISPTNDMVQTIGETTFFTIKPKDKENTPDSFVVYIGGERSFSTSKGQLSYNSNSLITKVGRQNIRINIYYNDSINQTLNTQLTVLSDLEPKNYQFRLIRKIPHDPSSYTQGLVYYQGYIYEGTGQKNRSKIRKIDPKDGKTLLERKIENEFFGEGITIFNDKLYQLTYVSKVGLIYNLETFEQIRKFDLQTSEGWGLTCDGANLIVSDGSSVLYFYDPEYFTQTNQLDVCDRKGLITRLNELEYVNGVIWANVYGQDYIVKIDPTNGKITGKVDLSSLKPDGLPDNFDYVLNGIAYNEDTQAFFVTGKLWPVVYEIRILEEI